MKCTVYIATTLDGMIAASDGSVSFLDAYNTPEAMQADEAGFGPFLASVDVIVMGRTTFETVLAFEGAVDTWPYGKTPIVIWTRDVSRVKIPESLQGWIRASAAESAQALVDELKPDYAHAYIDGGKVIQSFFKEGLITDLNLSRIPIILGKGIPLFCGDLDQSISLSHAETKALSTGIVQSIYRVENGAGNDKTS